MPRDGTMLLRVALPDRIGSLARLAGLLAHDRVDILRVEVVWSEPGLAVDDLLVRGADAGRALAGAPEVRLLGVREEGTLPDPGLAMAGACALVAEAEDLDGARLALVDAALALVGAHRGVLLRDTRRGALRPIASSAGRLSLVPYPDFELARRALDDGVAVTVSGDVEWGPEALRTELAGGAIAAVPVGETR